jgi:hypothetical protein
VKIGGSGGWLGGSKHAGTHDVHQLDTIERTCPINVRGTTSPLCWCKGAHDARNYPLIKGCRTAALP